MKEKIIKLTYPIAIITAGGFLTFSLLCFYFLWIPFSHFYNILVFTCFTIWGFCLLVNTERKSFNVFLPISFVIALNFHVSQFSATKVLAFCAAYLFMLFVVVLGVVKLKPPVLKVLISCLYGFICIMIAFHLSATVMFVGLLYNGMVVTQDNKNYYLFYAAYGVDFEYRYYRIDKTKTITLFGIGKFYNIRGESYGYHG